MCGESNVKKYEYLDHVADARFEAYGETLEEAFENAALAMFNVMIDTLELKPVKEVEIRLDSTDLKILLVDWLSELLYLFEVDEIVFSRFKVDRIKSTSSGTSLNGHAWGEPLDLSRHSFHTQVKAVTFHDLEVEKTNGKFRIHVIVDT